MTRKLRYLFVLLFVGVANVALAQTGGISGTITEKATGDPVIGAVVEVVQGGTVRGGAVSDVDGNYSVKPLNPGDNYEVRIRYATFKEIRLQKVLISPDRETYQDFKMEVNASEMAAVEVIDYKVPLINKAEPGTSTTYTGEQISRMPTRQTADVASLTGGVYQAKTGSAGSGLSIAGARASGTLYIIDGVQVNGVSGTNFPPNAIEQMQVITSGIPAKYGDATGGVISITTRGPSNETRGALGFEHSIDGYNHNLAYFNLSGPLIRKSIDSVNKRSVLGYAIDGQYVYDVDNDPSYYPNYTVKSDVLARLEQNPLVLATSSAGLPVLRSATEYVRASDLTTQKARVNALYKNYRVNGKLDYQVADNMNLSLGGNASYVNSKGYTRSLTLFSPSTMPTNESFTARGFVRFTQKFGKTDMPAAADGEEKKAPLISNAFYTLQADYQVTHDNTEDPRHGRNAFNYGYVGKFNLVTSPLYFFATEDSTGREMMRLATYDLAEYVDFQRSELNPLLANYTSQFYDYLGDNRPATLNNIQQGNALRNGDFPSSTYGLWNSVGAALGGFNYSTQEQFAFNVDAQFDLQPRKTKHQIEFGLYYQQRAERAYNLSAAGLWQLARQLTNSHITGLDLTQPIYVVNGQRYTLDDVRNGIVIPGSDDTVLYNRMVVDTLQSTFDFNLRTRLGLDPQGSDFLNVDALDPSMLSVDMFSADEIINSGNPYAGYYGYDHTGKRLNGQVNFNDWFTKKDANGNYTREIGAFRPNYIAGYIMDKFELPNDALFHLGLRIDRFDANTKVLKDPYSLYAVNTVATSEAVNSLNGGTHPENIGQDFVVYVNDNSSSAPKVIGYRNGDDWYDAFGKYVSDPTLLKERSGSNGDPQPDLQKTGTTRALTMRDEGYNPNTSFTDYTPQVNVMPRISFTFPIADKAMFYAHYDVLVQRPRGNLIATPMDYYYLNQNSNSIIANPDLRPEKMFDYELGFQQELTQHSAVTITAFYKERKDMIQVRPYLYAWPNTYYTYGNRDFSTTKGFILKYDLRRVGHISMLLNYTLQFVEGTGSSSVSSNGFIQQLIAAQLPNLRFAYPLTNDSRHQLSATIDYRYDEGQGPIVFGKHILQNAGANLIFRTRSGEPYTRYEQPSSPTVSGSPNGARLPWHYMMDLRIEKAFDVPFGKPKMTPFGPVSRYSLTAFAYITNLLNTKDILGVYGFTGRPDDDGWLADPRGIQDASIRVSPEAYRELYSISNQAPGLINNPRRINLGVQFNF